MMQEENLSEVFYFNNFLSIDSRMARVLLWEIYFCVSSAIPSSFFEHFFSSDL